MARHHAWALTLTLMMGATLWSHGGEALPVPGSVVYHGKDRASTVVLSPEQSRGMYTGDFLRWAREDDNRPPTPEDVLAIGSSSMRMWTTIAKDLAPLRIIHRGFGGSQMQDVVLMQSFFERYPCRRILIYQGDNDLFGPKTQPEANFLAPLRAFIAATREKRPDTEFYLISVKPSPSRMEAIGRYREANAALKAMGEADPKTHFIDVFTPMLGQDGQPLPDLFLGDRLHMNAQGYAIWTKAVRAALLGE